MATTDKLNRIIQTKQELKDAINNTQIETITDESFREYPNKIKSMQSKYEKYLSKVVAEKESDDNILELNDAYNENLLKLEIDGKSEQKTTKASFNIFNDIFEEGKISTTTGNNSEDSSAMRSKGYTLVNSNTEYILSNNGVATAMNVLEYDKDKNFIGYLGGGSVASGNSFITSENTKYLRFYRGRVQNFLFQVQKGNVITPYEQFVPDSPSPDYPQEIKCIPSFRNLFDGEFEDGMISVTTGNNIDDSSAMRSKDYTLVDSNTEYILSNNGLGTGMNVFEYGENKNFIGYLGNASVASGSSFKTSMNTKYLRFYRGKISNFKFQLEKGNKIHLYIPYGSWVKARLGGKNSIKNDDINNPDANYESSGGGTQPVQYSQEMDGFFTTSHRQRTFYPKETGTYIFSAFVKKRDDGASVYNITIYNPSAVGLTSNSNITSEYKRFSKKINITEENLENGFRAVFFNSIYWKDMQLEKVDEATNEPTEYQSYKEQEILVDLQDNELCSIDDIKDELDIKCDEVVLNKNTGKLVLDGSENWGSSTSDEKHAFWINVNNLPNWKYAIFLKMSNYFIYVKDTWKNAISQCICENSLTTSNVMLIFRMDNITGLTNWKNWLKEQYENGNPVIVYYILAEPYTISLGKIDPILLNEGYNKIELIEDIKTTMRAEYIADGNKLIRRDDNSVATTLSPSNDNRLVIPKIDTMPVNEELKLDIWV